MPAGNSYHRPLLMLLFGLLVLPVAARAQLLLHLPLDGDLGHSGQTGEPRFMMAEGAQEPDFVPGKFGQALRFDGEAAVAAPFNLDHAQYPRVTVTAWVREEDGASGSRAILSSLSSAGFRMGISGGTFSARVGSRNVFYSDAELAPGEWTFVAAVVDTDSGDADLYLGDALPFEVRGLDVTTKPPYREEDPADPDAGEIAWVVVGANSLSSFTWASRPLLIDDVRLYGEALDAAAIAAIREPAAPQIAATATVASLPQAPAQAMSVDDPDTPVGATSGGSIAQSNQLPDGCQSSDDCDEGFYCAIERICHPDRHAPIKSVQIQTMQAPPMTTLQPAEPPQGGSDASATGVPVPVGAAALSPVSGVASKNTKSLDLVHQFLTEIHWGETGDRPCTVSIAGEAAGNLRWEVANLEGCDNDMNPVGDIFTGSLSVKLRAIPERNDDAVARGVMQIGLCGNDRKNQRMKGLRITGFLVRADGSTYRSIDMRDSEELPHCRSWHNAVYCDADAGQLATGLVLHYTRATGRNEQIVGVQLICREIGLQ